MNEDNKITRRDALKRMGAAVISGAVASSGLISLASCIIRKTKCFDFWERNVLFPKTKRSFFRTPTLPFSA